MRSSDENKRHEKKLQEKALIPPSPTGFVSLFSAKVEGGAIGPLAQAGWGLSQAIGICTECNVFQRNVTGLHCVLQALPARPSWQYPGPAGRKIEKSSKRGVFV